MDEGAIYKYLRTLSDRTSEDKVLSVELYLVVDVGDHKERTLKIVCQVSDKMKAG